MSLSRSRILLFGGRFLEEHITYTYIYIWKIIEGGKKTSEFAHVGSSYQGY